MTPQILSYVTHCILSFKKLPIFCVYYLTIISKANQVIVQLLCLIHTSRFFGTISASTDNCLLFNLASIRDHESSFSLYLKKKWFNNINNTVRNNNKRNIAHLLIENAKQIIKLRDWCITIFVYNFSKSSLAWVAFVNILYYLFWDLHIDVFNKHNYIEM
jgi:hypothetical protein